MKAASTLLLLAASLVAAGCPSTNAPSDGRDIGTMPGTDRTTAPNRQLMVSFRMATVLLPAGTASGSEDLWSYVDEEAIGADTAAALGRNGMRVGVGRTSNWPDVADVLGRMTGRQIALTHIPVLPGSTIPINLKRRQPAQTIFLSLNDLSLTGEDYPPGTNLLAINCRIDENNRDALLVTGVPQITTTRLRPKLVNEGGARGFVPQPDWFVFDPLQFRLRMSSDEFLVIGPGRRASIPTSVGHHFLLRRQEGIDFETVLVLMPQITETDVVHTDRAGRPIGTGGR
jgi:hypothetical protein